jgi:hypothetical protein
LYIGAFLFIWAIFPQSYVLYHHWRKKMDIPMQVRVWRERAARGELTREEMREGVILLRGERQMSLEVQKIKKVRVTKIDALLNDFATQMEGADKP